MSGKVIEASIAVDAIDARKVGDDLRRLRLLSGLSRQQIAERMNVHKAAVSKIEEGGEALLSTVQDYVGALGASLAVDAQFPADAPLSLKLRDVLDVHNEESEQITFPFFEDEQSRDHRDIVLSIKPIYAEKILDGRKTVELRRRFPVSTSSGTVAYIYETSPTKAMVGTARIRDVLRLPVSQIWSEFKDAAFIERRNFDEYFEGLKEGFALILDHVRPFTKPIPLRELREKFSIEPPQSFSYAKLDLLNTLTDETAVVSN